MRSFGVVFALAMLGASLAAGEVYAQGRIGSATAISSHVEGLSRGAVRTLAVGNDVELNDIVRTGDAGVGQFVFLDQTSLNVGPKSTVTLDRFVYDPSRQNGTVVVRATRGLFRFMTGSQPSQNYTIQTPLATIGVRGTAFELLVRPEKVVVFLVAGEVRVVPRRGRAVVMTQPGTAVTVRAAGGVVGPEMWARPITDVATNAAISRILGEFLQAACRNVAPGSLRSSARRGEPHRANA